MRSSLRFLLRAAWSPWLVAVGVAVAMVIDLSTSRQPWRGEYLLGEEWLSTGFFLCSGACAAFTALDAMRLVDPAQSALLVYNGGWRRVLMLLFATWSMAIVIPTITTAGYMARDLPSPSNPQLVPALWQLLLSVASLLCLCVVGFCCGLSWGRLGVAMALLLGYGVGFLSMGSATTPLSFGGSNGSLLGVTIHAGTQLRQALLLAGFMLLLLAGLLSIARHRSWVHLTTVVALLGLVVVSWWSHGTSRFSPDTHTRSEACTNRPGYSVCATPEHARFLGDLATHQGAVVAVGHRLGLVMPQHVEEYQNNTTATPTIGYWVPTSDILDGTHVPLEDYVNALGFPVSCPAMTTPTGPSEAFVQASTRLTNAFLPLVQQQETGHTTPVDAHTATRLRADWSTITTCTGAR